MNFAESIISLYRKQAYQELNAYYQHQTVYNVLGVERNENRHSAFIAWLLNPKESHSLNDHPLRKFLALAAAKAYYDRDVNCREEVLRHLITGNYELKAWTIKTEQSIVGLADGRTSEFVDVFENGVIKNDAQNRFDIWMLLQVTFKDSDATWAIPVILENKIYSVEGNHADQNKAQTVRYERAMQVICRVLDLGENCQPLMIYLTPSGAQSPKSKSFLHVTYQELLDHVISPAAISARLLNIGSDARNLIDGYIRNLSCPARNDVKKDYSILGIDESENLYLQQIFDSDAYKTALCAIYPTETKALLKEEDYKMYEECSARELIVDFWNANEDLFKVVLYNQFKDCPSSLDIVKRIIKDNNRDNTRYWVGLNEGEWFNSNGKPASKSEASYLIFKVFCEQWSKENPNKSLSLEELREAFPGKLNRYYSGRYFQHLFYVMDANLHFDVPGSKFDGDPVNADLDTWDFYQDDSHEFPCVESVKIRSVKMWRKGDFDRLVEHAEKKFGILVIPAEK